MTGLRRAESPGRDGAGTLQWDAARGIVKINPIVAWSDDDVARYITDHALSEIPCGTGASIRSAVNPAPFPGPAGPAAGPAPGGRNAASTS